MKTLFDPHTHTIASGHAYSTLQEMAHAAAEKGIQVLGITEHAPGIPGTCDPIYFRNLHVVPREMYGVRLLLGVEGGTAAQNTEGMLAAIHNPWTHIISHPGDGTAELLFEPIVLAARDTHTLLEINSSSMISSRHKEVARPNNLEILRLCRKYDVPVVLGSDAHISFSIADYRYALPLLAETDFPDELVMNYWPEQALAYLGIENSKC